MTGFRAMPSANANRSRLPRWAERPIRAAINAVSISGNVTHGEGLRVGMGAHIGSFHGLTLGKHVSVGPRSIIEVDGSIGDYCLIARHVQIVGRMDHSIDTVGSPIVLSTWVGNRHPLASDAVTIGTDVWIGAGVLVLGGVTIGSASVIGAGAVVTRDIPAFSIAVGNPARVIGQRFATSMEQSAHLAALGASPQL